MTPKLMSYNQMDFQSKFHLEAELNRIEKNVKHDLSDNGWETELELLFEPGQSTKADVSAQS